MKRKIKDKAGISARRMKRCAKALDFLHRNPKVFTDLHMFEKYRSPYLRARLAWVLHKTINIFRKKHVRRKLYKAIKELNRYY